ncbi:MAG: site-2 protease family protein [Chloroflexi bacterium]|nr:site-2 protease family protein [Chloroflexota bacterium]
MGPALRRRGRDGRNGGRRVNEGWRDAPAQTPAHARGRPRTNLITAALFAFLIVFAFFYARSALNSALLFLLILVGLVWVHELAHFLTAKLFGVYVHEFGLGFPPRIWGKRIGETEYTINWLPIGGFVRLEGEENASKPRSLAAKPRWQRFIVLVSGAVANLLLPVVLFAAALSFPHEESIGRPVVTSVVPNAPAAAAGLKSGDVIYAVEDRNVKNVSEGSRYINLYRGREIEMRVKRGSDFVDLRMHARWAPPPGQGPTGISIASQYPFTERVALAPWESIPRGVRQTWDTLFIARNEIISWFKGASGPQLAGPVGIAQTTGEVARASESAASAVSPLLELAALLSVNLGILNLLPLPMLDGGRVLFLLIEVARRGKRIAPEREALIHLVGFAMFIVLAVVITFFDISRIAAGESIFR